VTNCTMDELQRKYSLQELLKPALRDADTSVRDIGLWSGSLRVRQTRPWESSQAKVLEMSFKMSDRHAPEQTRSQKEVIGDKLAPAGRRKSTKSVMLAERWSLTSILNRLQQRALCRTATLLNCTLCKKHEKQDL
jgi:hypothetical protein